MTIHFAPMQGYVDGPSVKPPQSTAINKRFPYSDKLFYNNFILRG